LKLLKIVIPFVYSEGRLGQGIGCVNRALRAEEAKLFGLALPFKSMDAAQKTTVERARVLA
jgi:hypothetical protein